MQTELTIGTLSRRSGVAPSALRYYEAEGLIGSTRTDSGHRRYRRDTLRRVAFIRVAQQVGLQLDGRPRSREMRDGFGPYRKVEIREPVLLLCE